MYLNKLSLKMTSMALTAAMLLTGTPVSFAKAADEKESTFYYCDTCKNVYSNEALHNHAASCGDVYLNASAKVSDLTGIKFITNPGLVFEANDNVSDVTMIDSKTVTISLTEKAATEIKKLVADGGDGVTYDLVANTVAEGDALAKDATFFLSDDASTVTFSFASALTTGNSYAFAITNSKTKKEVASVSTVYSKDGVNYTVETLDTASKKKAYVKKYTDKTTTLYAPVPGTATADVLASKYDTNGSIVASDGSAVMVATDKSLTATDKDKKSVTVANAIIYASKTYKEYENQISLKEKAHPQVSADKTALSFEIAGDYSDVKTHQLSANILSATSNKKIAVDVSAELISGKNDPAVTRITFTRTDEENKTWLDDTYEIEVIDTVNKVDSTIAHFHSKVTTACNGYGYAITDVSEASIIRQRTADITFKDNKLTLNKDVTEVTSVSYNDKFIPLDSIKIDTTNGLSLEFQSVDTEDTTSANMVIIADDVTYTIADVSLTQKLSDDTFGYKTTSTTASYSESNTVNAAFNDNVLTLDVEGVANDAIISASYNSNEVTITDTKITDTNVQLTFSSTTTKSEDTHDFVITINGTEYTIANTSVDEQLTAKTYGFTSESPTASYNELQRFGVAIFEHQNNTNYSLVIKDELTKDDLTYQVFEDENEEPVASGDVISTIMDEAPYITIDLAGIKEASDNSCALRIVLSNGDCYTLGVPAKDNEVSHTTTATYDIAAREDTFLLCTSGDGITYDNTIKIGDAHLVSDKAVLPSYKVSFTSNGGDGTMDAITGKDIKLTPVKNDKNEVTAYTYEIVLPSCGFTKTGYVFKNWELVSKTNSELPAVSDTTTVPSTTTDAPATETPKVHSSVAIIDGKVVVTIDAKDVKNNKDLSAALDITLQPVYELASYQVVYNANGGTYSEEYSIDDNGNYVGAGSSVDTEGTITVTSTAPSALTKDGYTLAGWNTKADGTGTAVNIDSISLDAFTDSAITLYAQWTPITFSTKDENLTLDLAGGLLPVAMYDNIVSVTTGGSTITNCEISKLGYIFVGWSYNGDESGLITDENPYAGQNIVDGKLTLTAIWVSDPAYKGKFAKTSSKICVKEKIKIQPKNGVIESISVLNSSTKVTAVTSGDRIVVTGKKAGTATIRVYFYGGSSVDYKVTVKKEPTKIKIKSFSLKKGKSKKLAPKYSPTGADTVKVTYKVIKGKSAIKISSSGKVTAKRVGKATIQAKTGNGKKCKFTITVKK